MLSAGHPYATLDLQGQQLLSRPVSTRLRSVPVGLVASTSARALLFMLQKNRAMATDCDVVANTDNLQTVKVHRSARLSAGFRGS